MLALTAAGVFGVFVVLPHPLEHVAQFLAGAVLIAFAASAGAWFAPRADLGTPIIDAALAGRPFTVRAFSVAALAITVGVVAAFVIVALDLVVFAPLVPEMKSVPAPPLWTSALAALYGGLAEETVWRYGAMSLLAWLFLRAVRGPAAYWAAIVGGAALFGVGLLPPTAEVVPLTPLVVARTVALNGVAGVAFGWLYWRRGLEAAMVAHGTAAAILHTAVRAIGG